MITPKKSLIGMKFGRLEVICQAPDRVVPSGQHKVMWYCRCECGNPELKAVDGYSLTHNRTQSCGCIHKETMQEVLSKPNKFDLSGDYGIGYTNKGEAFYFDIEDYDKIKDITWFLGKGSMYNYVVGHRDSKTVLMHRIIMEYDGEYDIDHKHGKETRNDNRKCNLRIATRSQNNMNTNCANSNTGIVGVHKLKDSGKFRAYICKYGENVNLGDFVNIDDAIATRKSAEERYFNEWSYDASQTCDDEYFNPNERRKQNEQ